MRFNKNYLVHVVLGHSYLVYFATLILGLLMDLAWPVHFHLPVLEYVGIVLLLGGPLLIIWAQSTSHNLAVKQTVTETKTTEHDFYRGPYTFTRSPTHLGLFTMVLGLGLIFNSIWILITTIIAFVLTRFVFLRKEEILLEDKYGKEYAEYKDKVPL
jgi:protein-S-isoprenylcysteine O-methyltransferase Ste14